MNKFIINKTKTKLDLELLKKTLCQVKENSNYGDILWGDNVSNSAEEDEVYKQIEKQLYQNNMEYSQFASDYIHGLLCNHANNFIQVKKGDEYRFLNTIWEIEEVFENHKKSAVLYANHRDKQMVLAFRTIFSDFKNLSQDNLKFDCNQVDYCRETSEKANFSSKQTNYNLSFTGYLNGAWLAEFSNYFSYKSYNNDKTRAVLFESPGIIKPKESIFSSLVKSNKDLNVVNYLTAPNFYNTFNKHEGKVFKLFTKSFPAKDIHQILDLFKELDETYCKISYPKFFYHGLYAMYNKNSLQNLLDEFDSFTGKPFYCEEVSKWPLFKINMTHNIQRSKSTEKKVSTKERIFNKIIIKNTSKSEPTIAFSEVKRINESEVFPNLELVIQILTDLIENNIDLNKFGSDIYHSKLGNILSETFRKDFNDFSLNFEKILETNEVNWFEDVLNLKTDSTDRGLHSLQFIDLKENFSNNSKCFLHLLSNIKSFYYIVSKDGTKRIVSNNYTVEFIRERFTRLEKLCPDIGALIASSKPFDTSKELRNYSPIADNFFVGRETIMGEALSLVKQQKGVIISALSGRGKSRLSIELANYFSNDFSIRWFNCESLEKFEKDYCDFAELLLKIDPRVKDIEMLIQMVNAALKSHQSKIMFVFDNVEKYEIIEDFIKEIPVAKVKYIITTKISNLTNKFKTLTLETFVDREKNEYFLKNLNYKMKEDHQKLLSKSLHLPLQLYLGINYINFTQINELMENLQDEKSIYKIIFNKIKYESNETFDLLSFCALLDADSISLNILNSLMPNISSHVIRLKNYGLIEIVYKENYIKMNRLIQKEFIHCNDFDQELLIKQIVYSLYSIIKNDKVYDKSLEIDYSQIKKINDKIKEENLTKSINYTHLFTIRNQYANFNLKYKRDFKVALQCFKELNRFLRYETSSENSNNYDLAKTYYGIAISNLGIEDYISALTNNLEALHLRKIICKEDPIHSFYLAESFHALGDNYFKLYKYKEAFENYTESLKIIKNFKAEKAQTADTLKGLGDCYDQFSAYQNSYDCYFEAYELRLSISRGDHADVARSLFDLAKMCDKLGDYDKAFKYYMESYQMRKTLYENDHPDLADSLFGLGNSYDKQGNFTAALEYNKKAYLMRKNLYKSFNFETLSALISATDILRQISTTSAFPDLNSSSDLNSQEIATMVNSNLHPYLAQSLNALGFCYLRLGDDKLALKSYTVSLRIREKLLKEKILKDPHPDLIESYNSLAIIYARIDEHSEAFKFKLKHDEMKKRLQIEIGTIKT